MKVHGLTMPLYNVMHLSIQGGLFFDRRLRNDTGFAFGTKYTPLSNPQDETSTPQTAVFNRLTGKLWVTIVASRVFPAEIG